MSRFITVETVSYVEVPDDVPIGLLLVDKNMKLPLIVAPTGMTDRSQHFDADVLTIQYRITEGRFYLHDEPRKRVFGDS